MTVRDSAAGERALGGCLEMQKWEFRANRRPTRPPGGIPMSCIVPRPRWSVKQKMQRHFRRCRHADVRIRYLMIFNLWNGRRGRETAAVLGVSNTTVYRVAA